MLPDGDLSTKRASGPSSTVFRSLSVAKICKSYKAGVQRIAPVLNRSSTVACVPSRVSARMASQLVNIYERRLFTHVNRFQPD